MLLMFVAGLVQQGCWLSWLPFLVICIGQLLLEMWEGKKEGVSFVEFHVLICVMGRREARA